MDGSNDTVLVTGAAGFIGTWVCRKLMDHGRLVIGIDNFCDFYDPAVKHRNAADLAAAGRFTLVSADIRDRDMMASVVARYRPGVVIHLAAMAGVRPSFQNPDLYRDVNVNGTASVLDAAVAGGVSRVLFASSSSVYGNAPTAPFLEEFPTDSPLSPYAATKIEGERLCARVRKNHDVSVTNLRLFTVFGPGQRPDLAIHRFLRSVGQGTPIKVFGDWASSRDYTYAGDIAAGICAAVDRALDCDVINLGGSHPVRLDELIGVIEEVTGRSAVIERLPHQRGDVERTWADIGRAGRLLGFAPSVALPEGVRRQWEWMRN